MLPNDVVFAMIGREAPLDFFRRCGVRIRGEWRPINVDRVHRVRPLLRLPLPLEVGRGIPVNAWFKANHLFPFNIGDPAKPATLLGTTMLSMQTPSFYYSLAYCVCIVDLRDRPHPPAAHAVREACRRSRSRRSSAFRSSCLPYIDPAVDGAQRLVRRRGGRGASPNALFPATEWDEHGREYWRSVGFILAWPLMIWNVFTQQPLWAWLVDRLRADVRDHPAARSGAWGKGAYCGWICSCGALAETMGDAHRQKMPHGPVWNRVNMLGQVFLVFAVLLLLLRIVALDRAGAGPASGTRSTRSTWPVSSARTRATRICRSR